MVFIWILKAIAVLLIVAIAVVAVLIIGIAVSDFRERKHEKEKRLPFCCLLQDGKKRIDPYGECTNCRIYKDLEDAEEEAQENEV